MYPLAVQAGINAKEYWELTYDELVTQLQGIKHQKEEEAKHDASLDYNLAHLIAYAFHQPDNMPDFDTFYQFEEDVEAVNVQKVSQEEQKFLAYFNRINQTMKDRKEASDGD
jgi:hypothetical protein